MSENIKDMQIVSVDGGECKGERPPLFCSACGKPLIKGQRYLRLHMELNGQKVTRHIHVQFHGSACSPNRLNYLYDVKE